MRVRSRLPAPALALVVLAVACGGSDGATVPAEPIGTLTVRLTDAPLEGVFSINVYVSGLSIKPSGEPAESIASELGVFDLLALQGTTAELVSLDVAPGSYEYIRIDLDQNRSSVVTDPGGSELPLAISSEEIEVEGGFEVPEDGETVLTLDFDAEASLLQLGNAQWRLTPVITQVVTGSP